jgi:hypothetical protein
LIHGKPAAEGVDTSTKLAKIAFIKGNNQWKQRYSLGAGLRRAKM